MAENEGSCAEQNESNRRQEDWSVVNRMKVGEMLDGRCGWHVSIEMRSKGFQEEPPSVFRAQVRKCTNEGYNRLICCLC